MSSHDEMMTFGGHLEVLRKILVKIAIITLLFAAIIFLLKDFTFSILLAPSEWDFYTYRKIEAFCQIFNISFHFEEFQVDLIATDLSSQFMTHMTTSIYLGLLCSSPFILFELFRFISPALLENERKYSTQIVVIILLLSDKTRIA